MAVHVAVLSSHRFAVPILPVVFVLVSGPLARCRAGGDSVAPVAPRRRRRIAVFGALHRDAISGVAARAPVRRRRSRWPRSRQRRSTPSQHGRSRFADAKRGLRPVVLLPDEYLPAGALHDGSDRAADHAVRQRRAGRAHRPRRARRPRGLHARHQQPTKSPPDRFATIAVPCRLSRDTPATLAIFSLGTADLAFEAVRLRWTGR